MKYCGVCKVNVHQQLDNCPLCGSYLDEEGKPFPAYEATEQYVQYPEVTIQQKVDFLRFKINQLILLAVLVCVGLNLFFAHGTITWSAYVIIGGVVTILCIMLPIAFKSKLYNQISVALPVLTVAAIMLELCITGFTSVSVTVQWFLPSFYVAAIVLCDVMIIASSRSTKYLGYFTTLLLCTALPVLLQLLLWIIPAGRVLSTNYTVCVFLGALFNIGTIAVVFYRLIKAEYHRKWSL